MSSETLSYRVDGITYEHRSAAVTDQLVKVSGVSAVSTDSRAWAAATGAAGRGRCAAAV